MPSEFDLIAKYFAPLAKDPGAFGLMDDAALLSPPKGRDLVLTKDAMVEGVHFRSEDPPDLVARKLQRVNLSDLAAKGATPLGYLLSVGLRRDLEAGWIKHFSEGLQHDQDLFSWSLLGGDTVSTPGPLTFSLTAIGSVPEGEMLKRSGAQDGDEIWVSGTIGDAYLGLGVLEGRLKPQSGREFLTRRYQLPEPRVALGTRLVPSATSCIDISDGFYADLSHILEASDARAELDMQALPVSEAALPFLTSGKKTLEDLATGGDDYELCFTAPQGSESTILQLAGEAKVSVAKVGTIRKDGPAVIADEAGEEIPLKSKGYDHFSK